MVYIDKDYKCHTTNPDGVYRKVETDFFNGKCDTFIEGYRFVPTAEEWTNEDGVVFTGEMVAPWRDCNELDSAQSVYERERLADAENALAIIYGGNTL